VVDGDSADVEQLRGIVQSMLADNPCAEAARAELETGVSAATSENESRKLAGSIFILMSDNCEVSLPEEADAAVSEEDLEVEVSEVEATVQDGIDQLVDDEENAAALIQSGSSTSGSFMRGLGIAFLFILLLLVCAGSAVAITVALTIVLLILAENFRLINTSQGMGLAYIAMAFYGGGFVGGVLGLTGCSYQLYTHLLS